MSFEWPRDVPIPDGSPPLPPGLAAELTFGTYALVGGCGVFLWDFVDNLRDDYKLISENRFRMRLPTITWNTGIGPVDFLLSKSTQAASITWDCARFLKIVTAFFPIAISATSLLFFLRLRAIFNDNKVVVFTFGTIWTTLFVTTFAFPTALRGVQVSLSISKYCIVEETHNFILAPNITLFVYDTLVFLAISWRLMTIFNNVDLGPELRQGKSVWRMIFGGYLPSLSRALLHDNQRFYAATVSLNLFTVIAFFVDPVPPKCRPMFAIPNIILVNMMACRVFRNTKFGLTRDTVISTTFLHSAAAVGNGNGNGNGENGAGPLPLMFNHERSLASRVSSDSEHRCRCQLYPRDAETVMHISKKEHDRSKEGLGV
ncbi:hypothetical protein BJ165DRAFT_1527913 [Panaeolus papilionaceus]|nr:hypothetical protein BJ165DRAFT_1527913 [Panaeolus papilionaceus]